MTPERQKWWDSLPEEERGVRELMRLIKSNIEGAKFMLNYCHINEPARTDRLRTIKAQKFMLSTLKNQIAMKPVVIDVVYESENSFKRGRLTVCPTCRSQVTKGDYNFHCRLCGQKLELLK